MPIWYWRRRNGGKNLGDYLGHVLPERLSGRSCRFEELDSGRPVHLSVGSVLHQHLHEKCVIWGSGFVARQPSFRGDIRITATRGPLSLQLLRGFGYRQPIAIGDPALLLPLFGSRQPVKPDCPLGVIAHYVDVPTFLERSRLAAENAGHGARMLDIETEDVEAFVDELVRCRLVVSSSLHGLILAHAYGVPALWVKFSDKVIGGNFKFHDYFLSVSIPPYEAFDFSDGPIRFDDLVALHSTSGREAGIVNFHAAPLIEACPFAARAVAAQLLARAADFRYGWRGY